MAITDDGDLEYSRACGRAAERILGKAVLTLEHHDSLVLLFRRLEKIFLDRHIATRAAKSTTETMRAHLDTFGGK